MRSGFPAMHLMFYAYCYLRLSPCFYITGFTGEREAQSTPASPPGSEHGYNELQGTGEICSLYTLFVVYVFAQKH